MMVQGLSGSLGSSSGAAAGPALQMQPSWLCFGWPPFVTDDPDTLQQEQEAIERARALPAPDHAG